MLSLRKTGLVLIVAVLFSALGVGIGANIFAPPVPESLAAPMELYSAPVSQRLFDDERSVRMTVHLRKSEPVLSPVSGRVTRLFLSPETELLSGAKVMEVDSLPVIALHTASPLYRDVADGLEGSDIEALQQELSRLGYDVPISGKTDWTTRWALSDLLGIDDGHGGTPQMLPRSSIVWLPTESVRVSEVKVRLNDVLTDTSTLMTLTGGALSGTVTIPEGALPGERIVFYQEKTYPVAENGVIEDQELLAAIISSAYDTPTGSAEHEGGATKSEVSLSVPWRLAHPTNVHVLPAAALFGLVGNHGCVADMDGKITKVEVIGSELGQTFVLADSTLSEVALKTEGIQCP